MIYGTEALIDISALKFNLARIRKIGAHRKIMAMIKANAYGHGLLTVAKALQDADSFGVASVDEALTLRNAKIKTPTVALTGFYNEDELELLLHHKIDAVVHQPLQIKILEQFYKKKNIFPDISIWLKVDTGMHRLGFLPDAMLPAYQKLSRLLKPGALKLMTHLADADNSKQNFTLDQIALFKKLTQDLPGEKSIANSAAILSCSDALADWMRPGILLYGISPFALRTGEQEGFKPVMTLRAKLIAVKTLKCGEYIGYGCSFRCPEDMPVGIVSVGYGDGYPRHARSGTPVLINGVICPLVGRVSMDMITVDLRMQPQAKIGSDVILWGNGLPAEKVAAYADTIAYQLLCNVTKRVKFIEC